MTDQAHPDTFRRRRILLAPLYLLLALLQPACSEAGTTASSPAPAAPASDGDHAVILQYHFVAENTPRVTSVTPAEFRAHVDHLIRHDYSVLPLPELLERLRRGEALPPRSVAITFDDAYISVYTEAFPMLREAGLPFTVFVNTRPVDAGSRAFTSWAQLREMLDAGATIANHTVSHAYLVRGDDGESQAAFEARMAREVEAAEQRIEEQLGVSERLFAYPFGEYDDRLRAWLDDHDYIGIGQHSGAVFQGSDFLALPRFPFSGRYAELEDFAEKLDTRPLPVLEPETLAEPTLATSEPRPVLEMQLGDGDYRADQLACYASGQGRIEVETMDTAPLRVRVRANEPVLAGRSRYNCTAPHVSDGTWYWYSHPWLREIGPDTPL